MLSPAVRLDQILASMMDTGKIDAFEDEEHGTVYIRDCYSALISPYPLSDSQRHCVCQGILVVTNSDTEELIGFGRIKVSNVAAGEPLIS